MSYKWKPSKSQRKEFAIKMKTDEAFANAYYQRKEQRASKRRSKSEFDYNSAGGYYIPTKIQHDAALKLSMDNPTDKQVEACNMVLYGYTCNEKIHHDYIHIVNEYIRNKNF